ncbi:DUF871 domain-containing protein [Acetonema longum]|uniref:Outer surface protein n=1 Tax=Acetonema longum DSM 6540 TaxID=1009370 RepID=F7NNS1_9FIRM|nr:MupG family TIM beta-alpha barrel fold protein [Acetonema longum]EGO62255.1 outer surface protein [Acetonema longum DSM 6540]
MIEKGISLYAGMGYSPEQCFEYLSKARQAGFSRLFTSLHIPEADETSLLAEFRLIAGEAGRLGFGITADISPRAFRLLGASLDHLKPVRELGIDVIRLDFGFDAAAVAVWTKTSGLAVELNASTMDEKLWQAILAAGADTAKLRACHNFYPRPDTGLGWELFVKRSALFREQGIPLAAFIPSLVNPRGPIYAGLPTLERHRVLGLVPAAKELIYSGLVDCVLFGDPLADAKELAAVGQIDPDCVELEVVPEDALTAVEQEILFAVHANRLDPGESVIRSSETRNLAKEAIKPRKTQMREAGNVTIDNELYRRYMGELQVIIKTLPADERVNVVARIAPEEMGLLQYIQPGRTFCFRPGPDR